VENMGNKFTFLESFVVVLMFIGVAFAPCINSTGIKASNDNDLVEVTSQACGIQGFGNTTVKLTKQQYRNLEQYLIDFRARLNQTTTREEAIPIFKDAVVELNKYGLLPKGMSVEQAQKLVIGHNRNRDVLRKIQSSFNSLSNKGQRQELFPNWYNVFCLFYAVATPDPLYYTQSTILPIGPYWLLFLLPAMLLSALGLEKLAELWAILIIVLDSLNPVRIMNLIFNSGYYFNFNSFGLNGHVTGTYELFWLLGFTGLWVFPIDINQSYFFGNVLGVM
jgi:hypothetical protein